MAQKRRYERRLTAKDFKASYAKRAATRKANADKKLKETALAVGLAKKAIAAGVDGPLLKAFEKGLKEPRGQMAAGRPLLTFVDPGGNQTLPDGTPVTAQEHSVSLRGRIDALAYEYSLDAIIVAIRDKVQRLNDERRPAESNVTAASSDRWEALLVTLGRAVRAARGVDWSSDQLPKTFGEVGGIPF